VTVPNIGFTWPVMKIIGRIKQLKAIF